MAKALTDIQIRRHFDGSPILAPTDRWWENGVTFNAACTYVPQTPENQKLITRLLAGSVMQHKNLGDGVVAVHYRARPKTDPGYLITRSYVGLALFTPDLELIYRYPEPVLSPDSDKAYPDYLGAEDPRITLNGDKFVMSN